VTGAPEGRRGKSGSCQECGSPAITVEQPQWLEDQYRLPAAEVLRQTSNFLDLSGLKR